MEAWKILLLFSLLPILKKRKKKFSTTDHAGAQRFKSNAMLMRHCIYIRKLHGQTFNILFLLLSFSSITCLQTFSSNQISPCYKSQFNYSYILISLPRLIQVLKGLLRTVWALSLGVVPSLL